MFGKNGKTSYNKNDEEFVVKCNVVDAGDGRTEN